ncbi:hypothetical protein [Haloarcula pellucida]|uniref:Uncharacterized protein n=1 Tax=Haloarcula pellucida TaxID=1427151 RepID=A0A830GTD9_9EURY|nr:hypothetical protein [Halomicroarcula pellucida]MBX0350229.1 hypothetical protein [Halomicroarcula pellucida]GGO01018.1 hypothetical protein GCM10009030_34280 [Halomicroarcula pellucida]
MTDNHQYETPAAGTLDWDEPLNRNFERIDTDVEIRDVDANRSNYVAKAGAKFLATDTGDVYIGDGGSWSQLGTIGADGTGDTTTVEGAGVESLLLDGFVVAIGRSLAAPQTIDPAGTDTPIQDALDLVAANGGGEVRLPAGVVEETGPIRPYEETQILGLGVEISKVAITDRTADGILFDRDAGVDRVKLDGFALNGPAGTQPTGVAIRHANRDTQDLQVGRLLFWGWNNAVYRVDEGVGPFQCRHDQLTIYECDAGDQDGLFEFRSWYGPANWFGTIAAYPSATVSGQNTTVFFSRGGTQTVDYLTMGGSAGVAVHQTWDSMLEFGNVHWEPTTNPTSPPAIVRLLGHGTAVVDTVKHVTGTAGYVYELGYDSYNGRGPARKVLGPYIELGAAADVTSNVVNLSAAGDPSAPSLYHGAPEDVSVTHSDGNTGCLRALGTAGTGF